MPKQVLQITNFAGGLNAYSDARDIEDNQFVQNWNAVVDKNGIIRVSGMAEDSIETEYFDNTNFQKGHGLFQFTADYSLSGIDGNLSTGITTGTIATYASTTSFTLEDKANTSSADDFYNDFIIYIYSGNGLGQSRKITDYTGSSRTVTCVAFPSTPSEKVLHDKDDATPSKYIIYRWTPSSNFKGDGTNNYDWIHGDSWNERHFLTKSGTVSTNESNDLGYIEYEPKLTLTPGVNYSASFECSASTRYYNNVSDGKQDGNTTANYGDRVPWVELYSPDVVDTQGSIKTLSDNTPSPTGGTWDTGRMWENVTQTSTSGTGTGAKFTIVVATDDTITVYLTSERGTGYVANDTIVLTDPGNTTNTATITVSHINITGLSLMSSGIEGIGYKWISGIGRNGDASNYITTVDANYINNGDFVESLTAVTGTGVVSNESTVSATDSSVTLTVDGAIARESKLLQESIYKSDGTFIGICTAVNSTTEIVFGRGVDVDIANDTILYKKINGWDIVRADNIATSDYSSHALTIAQASTSPAESYDGTACSIKITSSNLGFGLGWLSQTVYLEENTPYNLNFLYHLKAYGMADYRIIDANNTAGNVVIKSGYMYPTQDADDSATPNASGYEFYQRENEIYNSGVSDTSNFSYIQFTTPKSNSSLEAIPIKIQFRPIAFNTSSYALFLHGITLQKNYFDISNMNYLNPQANNPFTNSITNYSTYTFNFTVPNNYSTDDAWVFRIYAGKYGYRTSSDTANGTPPSSQEITIQNIKITSDATETVTLLSDNTFDNSIISAYTSSSNSWIRNLFNWSSVGAKPVYNYINGMLKISDGNFNTNNENKLLYYSKKTLPENNIYPQWIKTSQIIPTHPSTSIFQINENLESDAIAHAVAWFRIYFAGDTYAPKYGETTRTTNWPMDDFGPLNFNSPGIYNNNTGILIRAFTDEHAKAKNRGTLWSEHNENGTMNTNYQQIYNPNTQWYEDNILYQDSDNPNYLSDSELDILYSPSGQTIGESSSALDVDREVISNLGLHCKGEVVDEDGDSVETTTMVSMYRNHEINSQSARNPLSLVMEPQAFETIHDSQGNSVSKIKYIDIKFRYESVGIQTSSLSSGVGSNKEAVPPVFNFSVGVVNPADYDIDPTSIKSKMINGDEMSFDSSKPSEIRHIGDNARDPLMYSGSKSIWDICEGDSAFERYDSKDRLKNAYIGRGEYGFNDEWHEIRPGEPIELSMDIEDRIEFPLNSTINIKNDAILINLKEIINHEGIDVDNASSWSHCWSGEGSYVVEFIDEDNIHPEVRNNNYPVEEDVTYYSRFIIESLDIGFYNEETIDEIELAGNSVGINFSWGGEDSEGIGWADRMFEVATTSVNAFGEESSLSGVAGIVGKNEEGAHCSLGQYSDKDSCELNGGTWHEIGESFIRPGQSPDIRLKMISSRLNDIYLNKTKVYMRDTESDIWYLQFYIDHENRKLYSSTSSMSSDEGVVNDVGEIEWSLSKENFKNFNEVNSYESETMVSQEDGKNNNNLTARYKTSTIANNRLYVGNIKQNDKIQGDRMLKSPIGKYNILPKSSFVDVAINDGDEITALAYYKDKILQFKKRKVFVINISGDYEFLEDTFENVGVLHQASVTKTPYGIVWANKTGCYLYDGEEMTNLIDGKIPATADYANTNVNINNYWFASKSTLDGDCVVGYMQDRDTLLIKWTAGSVATSAFTDAITYHFPTKSWIFNFNSISGHTEGDHTGQISNMITDVNGDILYYRFRSASQTYSSNGIKKWNNASLVTGNLKRYTFTTKDFTFGDIINRKKIYKVYVTYKTTDGSDSKILVYAGINGGSPTVAFSASASKFAGTSTACYSASNGLLDTGGDWKIAELRFTTSSTFNNIYSFQLQFLQGGAAIDSGFEINDISIVFKTKRTK